jgi:flagellar motor switch protein FliN
MKKNKEFNDPLKDIDSLMGEAFLEKSSQKKAKKEKVKKKVVKKVVAPVVEDKNENLDEILEIQQEEKKTPEASQQTTKKLDEILEIQQEEEIKQDVPKVDFPVAEEVAQGPKLEKDVFSNIPVNVSVELGKTKMTLQEIYELGEGSVIELDKLVGEPLELVVSGQVVASGEVVAVDNYFGLRLTKIQANLKE